jgi:hypothetical protein
MATLTSKLEAVNTMLGYIGESPVNSIATATALPLSAALAKNILDEVSREVQSDGWQFNTVENFKLAQGIPTGTFQVPENTLQVDAVDRRFDIVQRGLNLWDRYMNTKTFNVPYLYVDMTFLLDWEDLPEQARRYIAIKAGRTLQSRLVGSRELENLILRDEMMAKARLEETDGRNSDITVFDNYDVAARIGINRNIYRGVGTANGGGGNYVAPHVCPEGGEVIPSIPGQIITDEAFGAIITEDSISITTEA